MTETIDPRVREACLLYFNGLILEDAPLAFVAGGAVRDWFSSSKITSDVDLWFKNVDDANKTVEKLRSEFGEPMFESDGVVNFAIRKHKIQIIRRVFFQTPEDVLNYFDFTISCAAVSTVEVIVHPQFFSDLCRRRLNIANLPHPRTTLNRVLKYERKGFRICPDEMNKLVRAVHKLQPHEIDGPVFYVD
jgi:hypothetical protein